MGHTLSVRLWSAGTQRLPPLPAFGNTSLLAAVRQALAALKPDRLVGSPGLRHATRLCLATTAAFLVVRIFHVPFGYWATMATLFVLQPANGTTLPRSLERAAGSAAGAMLAAAIGLLVHSPLSISLVVFPLICLTMGLRRVSYSLYVVFLTPSFVLVADFATPANELMYALDRLGNNVLGCLAALLATWLVWPVRSDNDLKSAVRQAIETNLAYLAAATHLESSRGNEIEALRRNAGLASTHAEELYRCDWPGHAAERRKTVAILALLRRILGTAALIQNSPVSAGRGSPFHEVLAAAIDTIREQTDAPPGIPSDIRLRPIEYESLRQLAELCILLHDSSAYDGMPNEHPR